MTTSVKKISKWQWLVIILFALIIFREFFSFANKLSWLIQNNKLFDLSYSYIPAQLLLDLVGLYGLFILTKFKRIGFYLFYLTFLTSSLIDGLLRTRTLTGFIISLLGNLILFLIFQFSTRSIFKLSSSLK
jgi:hypothetical protein